MRKRVRLIYNPTAGREKIEKHIPMLLNRLEKAGYESSCIATEKRWSAAEEATRAAKNQFEVVIAAGGDGTIHEVINGLAQVANPPKLGIIPAGTTNDFARAMKIPRDFSQACEIIAQGKTVSVDIGKVQDRYFINVAAAGLFAEVAYEAPSRLKSVMGPFAYYAKALEKLSSLHQSFSLTIKTEDKEWTEELLLLIIANSVSVAGFQKFAPLAQLSDGLFDVLLIHKGNIPDLVQIAALAFRGEHIHDSRVTYFQAKSLEIQPSQPLSLNLDGEWGGECAGRFEIVPNFLEIFCP